nr:MAG TPA: hypothetical protein [Caudoviricetes sp.]
MIISSFLKLVSFLIKRIKLIFKCINFRLDRILNCIIESFYGFSLFVNFFIETGFD